MLEILIEIAVIVAIVVLQVQYDAMTPADIQTEKQRRWDDWIVIVNPPEEPVNG